MSKDELKAEFDKKGLLVIDEFDHEGQRFTVYKINPNNPFTFVTGDKFDWAFGLRYDTDIRQIVMDYNVEDEIKRKIESVIRFSQN